MISLIDYDTGAELVDNVIIRSTFLERLKGFSFCKNASLDLSMLFLNTKRIHTFGMYFPLDIYFFDYSMIFLDNAFNVPPNRTPLSPAGTKHILEIPSIHIYRNIHFRVGVKVTILYGVEP